MKLPAHLARGTSQMAPVPSGAIVLGFDPGTKITGWGVIEAGVRPKCIEYGVVRTSSNESIEIRLNEIYTAAWGLIEKHKPTIVAVEDPFVGKNPASAITLGEARGVLLLAAVRNSVPVAHYSPRLIKSAVVGRGSATKDQVQYMIQRLLNLSDPPSPLDASDGLAVALCHIHRNRIPNLIRR